MRKRGLTDFKAIHVDPWAPGLLDPKTEPRTTRWARALSYLKGTQKNVYARPIEGVVAVVDLTRMRVDRVIDTGSYPVPPQAADLDPRSVGPQRIAPKPLLHVQPEGPSFTVRGHEIAWQKWRFRFAVHPREGLVIHTVRYEDEQQLRPVLYRASLSEMLVPYADPSRGWSFRNAFDEGEYGIGRLTDALEIGTTRPRTRDSSARCTPTTRESRSRCREPSPSTSAMAACSGNTSSTTATRPNRAVRASWSSSPSSPSATTTTA